MMMLLVSMMMYYPTILTDPSFCFSCFFLFFHLQAEEEVRALQKKIQAVENELDQVQENLGNANSKLDEKDKALQIVSTNSSSPHFIPPSFFRLHSEQH
jgi:septal ring factor EnvC (AmiA/AmiB activator)